MNILVDTDILLSIESDHMIHRHLSEVLRIINELHCRIVIHPSTVKEIEEDQDIPNKMILLSKIKKYSLLTTQSNPYDDETFFKLINKPASARDKVDAFLLYCLYKNEVNFILTEDPDMIGNAALLNISDKKIMNIVNAFKHFKGVLQKKVSLDEGPTYYFYQNGDTWQIGEKGAVGTFEDMKGFHYIHVLLSNKRKNVSCKELYDAVNGSYIEVKDKTYLDEYKDEEQDNEYFKEIEKKFGKGPATLSILKKAIIQREEELMNYGTLSIEDRQKKDEELRKIKAYQISITRSSKKGEYDPSLNKARLSVLKATDRALKKISNNCTSPISSHLNAAINTGYKCAYNPVLTDTSHWILHPNEIS